MFMFSLTNTIWQKSNKRPQRNIMNMCAAEGMKSQRYNLWWMKAPFILSHDPEYYKRMLPMMGQKFVELIRIVEAIENGLKNRKVTSLIAQQTANKFSLSVATGFARNNKEDFYTISLRLRPKTQRSFASGFSIGNFNQFPTSNIYLASLQDPIHIYYAQ